jgi:hypothetical protein
VGAGTGETRATTVAACARSPTPSIRISVAEKNQERESSESPMLNAFWRVAPSVLFNFLAIFAAAVFFFANDFNSRISVAVQARRFFDFLAINPPFQERQTVSLNGGGRNTTHRVMSQDRVMSQVRSFVRDAPHIAQLKLMRGFVRSFFSNLRRFTQIQLLVAG